MEFGNFERKGHVFTIILPQKEAERISKYHFRRSKPLAGNFSEWYSLQGLYRDSYAVDKIADEIGEAIQECLEDDEEIEGDFGGEITFGKPIGWPTTLPLRELPPGVSLEDFSPNKWTSAKRVAGGFFYVPKTNKMSIVYGMRPNDQAEGETLVTIFSIHPGQDVPLGVRGQNEIISPKEAVFLGWNLPGRP